MSDKTKPEDYAFSSAVKEANENAFFMCGGLTKREYFAALAMQGLCSNYDLFKKAVQLTDGKEEIIICKSAVEYADALIEALNKESGNV